MRRVGVGVAAVAVLVLGCIAAGGPQDRHFALEAGRPESVLPEPLLSGTLVVRRPAADGLTDGLELVYRETLDSPELRKHTYALWVDSPSRLLQRELVAYLRAAGFADRIVPPEVRLRPDYELTTWVHRLDHIVDGSGTIVLSLEFFLMRAGDRELVLNKVYRDERRADGSKLDAAVAAYGEALNDILGRFVEDVQRAVASAPRG